MFKKVVFGLLFIIVLCAGAIGGYFYYQSESKRYLAAIIEELLPIAVIEVDDITVDYKGHVTVSNIDVSPAGYQDEISINRIEYKQASIVDSITSYFFQNKERFDLEIKLTSVIFDADADFIDKEKNNISRTRKQEPTLWGLACGDNNDFFSVIRNIGLARTHSDVVLKIKVTESGKVLKTSVAVNSLGLVSGLFELDFSSRKTINVTSGEFLRSAHIARSTLNVTDNGFNIKRIKHCADKEEIPEASYPLYFEENIKLKLLNGTAIQTSILKDSILSFLQPQVNVVLNLRPEKELFLANVLDKDFDVITAPELMLAVNGKDISTKYLSLYKENRLGKPLSEFSEKKEKMLAEIRDSVVKKKIKKIARYRDIELEELFSLKGKEIRIRTLLGKEIDGVLMEVIENKIVLQRRIEQGWVTYPVTKSNIASLKVFR